MCRSGDNGSVLSALSAIDGADRLYSSANSTPRLKRKRLRSATPSEGGGQSNGDDYPRSPLAKRKKLAADRTGYSKLKEGVTADELTNAKDETTSNGSTSSSPRPPPIPETSEEGSNEQDDDDDDEYEEEEEDDFLAREMEEEWG